MNKRKPHYLPTPEEIREQCELIQSGWSEEEERKRVVGGHDRNAVIADKIHYIRTEDGNQ